MNNSNVNGIKREKEGAPDENHQGAKKHKVNASNFAVKPNVKIGLSEEEELAAQLGHLKIDLGEHNETKILSLIEANVSNTKLISLKLVDFPLTSRVYPTDQQSEKIKNLFYRLFFRTLSNLKLNNLHTLSIANFSIDNTLLTPLLNILGLTTNLKVLQLDNIWIDGSIKPEDKNSLNKIISGLTSLEELNFDDVPYPRPIVVGDAKSFIFSEIDLSNLHTFRSIELEHEVDWVQTLNLNKHALRTISLLNYRGQSSKIYSLLNASTSITDLRISYLSLSSLVCGLTDLLGRNQLRKLTLLNITKFDDGDLTTIFAQQFIDSLIHILNTSTSLQFLHHSFQLRSINDTFNVAIDNERITQLDEILKT